MGRNQFYRFSEGFEPITFGVEPGAQGVFYLFEPQVAAVPFVQDAPFDQPGQVGGGSLQCLFFALEAVAHLIAQGEGEPGYVQIGLVQAGDNPLGCGGRGLDPCIGHQVDDGIVALVADAGDDGQGKLGNVGRQRVAVEAVEVGGGAAAPDDDYPVEQIFVAGDAVEGFDNRAFGLCAPCIEAVKRAVYTLYP